jgi:hypothetical protein
MGSIAADLRTEGRQDVLLALLSNADLFVTVTGWVGQSASVWTGRLCSPVPAADLP